MEPRKPRKARKSLSKDLISSSVSGSSVSASSSRPQPAHGTNAAAVGPRTSSVTEQLEAHSNEAYGCTLQKQDKVRGTRRSGGEARVGRPTTHTPRLNFAVLGARGAGKSTFVRCALDLKKTAASQMSSKKMALDGDIFLINLLEISVDETEISANRIQWPEVLDGTDLPRVDGVLALYDVTNRESLRYIPKLLSE